MSWDSWQGSTETELAAFLGITRDTVAKAADDLATLARERLEAAFTEFGGGGTGDVVGPSSSTTNQLARYANTTGKLLKAGGAWTLDDSGVLAGSGGTLALTSTTITGLAVGSVSGAEATANKGAANGYAPLNSSTKIALSYLGTGSPGSGNYLRGDGAWTAISVSEVSGAEATANKGNANGYAELDSGALVPTDQLGTVTATADYVLRGDQTWGNLPLAALPAHTHAGTDITSGTVAAARLGSGTADADHVLAGDSTWRFNAARRSITAGTAVTLSTTLIDYTPLNITSVPVGTYEISGGVHYTSAGTPKIKIGFAGTATYTLVWVTSSLSASAAPLTEADTAEGPGSVSPRYLHVRGVLSVTSAGSFKLQYAQAVSNATATQVTSGWLTVQ